MGNANTRVDWGAKVAALQQREAKLREAIATEKIRQQKAKERLEAREFAIVGEVLVRYAAQSPEFNTMLRQVLPIATSDEKARRFLHERGWM